MAQLFIGRKSLIIDVYGMSTEKQFVNTLEDVNRKRGAMDKLSRTVQQSKYPNEFWISYALYA